MKILIVYVASNYKNKNLVEILNYDKLYLKKFNLLEIYSKIKKYEYLIYLNDNTNYDFNNLNHDIEKSIHILNKNKEIDQIMFYNLIYNDIDEKILQINNEYIKSQINILNSNEKNTENNQLNYSDYIDGKFNRLFLPSFINIKILLNYNDILINQSHYEFNFLKRKKINRIYLNNNKEYITYEENKIIENINDNLTIVTGYIELNEKKINKYETQQYEYLEKCINTLKIDINMVIYVSNEKIHSYVYEKRKEFNLLKKTKIIIIDECKFMYFFDNFDKIQENVKKNIINYSNAKKILSVASRYNYLKDAIYNNYFESEYFAWCDFSLAHAVDIPNKLIFNDDFNGKIKAAWIGKLINSKTFKYNHKVLAGGFFIGNIDAMTELIKEHHNYFEKLLKYGFTINDDKLLFLIFESNPYLFKTYFSVYYEILNKINTIEISNKINNDDINSIEINNNININDLYDGKTWIHGKTKENINFTIFIITISSSQLEHSLNSINNMDLNIPFIVNCIKDISPTNKAYNEMRLRCKTKYFIQNDEDMELYSNCLEIITDTINKYHNEKIFLHTFKLIDDKLGLGDPPIIDCLKVYNQEIMKKYPTVNNGNNEISSVDSTWHKSVHADGFISNETNIIIGCHGKHRTNFDLLLRYCKIIKSLINPNIKTNSSHICKFLRPLFKENNINQYVRQIIYLFSKIKTIDYGVLKNIINKLNMNVDNNKLIMYKITSRVEIKHFCKTDLIPCEKNIFKIIDQECLMALLAIGSVSTNSYEYSYDKYPYDIYRYFTE